MKRRIFLRNSISAGAVAIAASAGLLTPTTLLGAWNTKAFKAKKTDDAINAIFGTTSHTKSEKINLKTPAIAENGAVTPVTVDAKALGGVTDVAILADKNPIPLVCIYSFKAGIEPYVGTRIKLGQTMNVVAVAKSGGKLYSAAKEVKVTIGGCGG